MPSNKDAGVVLRPKRQITIPQKICEQLGIEPGDMLELVVEGSVLKAKPMKVSALEALAEIQEAFKRSGITEEELLRAGRDARREITRERNSEKG